MDAPSPTKELEGRVALVTGGGRGIGRNITRELTSAGMRVALTARTKEQVEDAAAEIGGLAIVADVSVEEDVQRAVRETGERLGQIDLLVNNAGIDGPRDPIWEHEVAEWWHAFQVNVLGAYLCCRAVLPGMVERGEGRIVNIGSGASYLPVSPGTQSSTAYAASKAALGRFSELLAAQVGPQGVHVFVISPGLVRTDMTEQFGDDMPWTPPELAPRLVRALASGRADALAGRYIHAEHDDIEELIGRAEQVVEDDLNSIRLRR